MAALDPYRGYASALRTALPQAVRVHDAFHVVRFWFGAVDGVRRRIQREQTGRRGHRDDPLYGIRRLLRRAPDHHSDRSWERRATRPHLGRYPRPPADLPLPDRARAEQALYQWLAYCADSEIPELTRLAATIVSLCAELLAYFDTGGVSNGPTEASIY